ncbi:MAG: DUF4832 domain-containing protein [Clostridia bacterium]
MKKTLAGLLLMAMFAMPSAAIAMAQPISSLTFPFAKSELVLENPFMGNLVWANDESAREQPFSLVYADLTWREFEPKQGEYDFAAFEESNHFAHWKSLGKRVVFRFVMDVPGKKAHRDLPDWLYEATGDGESYATAYGKGYSPRYENPLLIEAHRQVIAALGKRYGQDPTIAFVELGSLGHWGEWHTHSKLADFPKTEVSEQYVTPYLEYFSAEKLLMRRPFQIASREGMGLYNDATGALSATERWLGWIQAGGTYDGNGEENALAAMSEAWKTAPIGGELTTGTKRETLLTDEFEQLLALLKSSHTSWIGPGSFANMPANSPYQEQLDEIARTIGYRLRAERLTVSTDEKGAVEARLIFTNDGIAPFYFDWPCVIRLVQKDGSERRMTLGLRLMDVLPGAHVETAATLDTEGLQAGEYRLDLAILDPETNLPGVALAMDAPENEGWYTLAWLEIGNK